MKVTEVSTQIFIYRSNVVQESDGHAQPDRGMLRLLHRAFTPALRGAQPKLADLDREEREVPVPVFPWVVRCVSTYLNNFKE